MLPVRSDLSKRAASVRFVCTAKASRAGPPGAADEHKERGGWVGGGSGKCIEGGSDRVRD